MTFVKPMITPKHLGLTVFLHHSYGSKQLIEDLNSHGYTLPYTEVRHFLTSAAIHMANVQQQTESGMIYSISFLIEIKIYAAIHMANIQQQTESGRIYSISFLIEIKIYDPGGAVIK